MLLSFVFTEGYVIANDVDNKRCYLMVHQVKRLQSPCCAIVNHDATTLPNIRVGVSFISHVIIYRSTLLQDTVLFNIKVPKSSFVHKMSTSFKVYLCVCNFIALCISLPIALLWQSIYSDIHIWSLIIKSWSDMPV